MALDIIQLGLNTADLPATLLMYSQVFGFENGGGNILAGDVIRVQGLGSDSHALIWWMVGAQPMFQLEFFHHTRPAQRPLPKDWTPADHGWTRFGVAVADFDPVLTALVQRNIPLLGGTVTVEGGRRAAFRDPHVGVIVEVMEDCPAVQAFHGAPGTPAIVYAAASVSDLGAAREYYAAALDLEIAPAEQLHPAGSDALWGMAGVEKKAFIARSNRIALEICEYAQPAGRARPADYRFSDQGLVNVALGAATKAPVEAALARLAEKGYVPPYRVENDSVVAGYINDAEREVEIATAPPELAAMLGWVPTFPFLVSLK
jgi:catechol 2,3-dioxygenase-like lactoylglutathione lyase family enzyme